MEFEPEVVLVDYEESAHKAVLPFHSPMHESKAVGDNLIIDG